MKDKIKIHILFEFKEGPWGGGNQFLKALRNYFIEKDVYANNINEAQIVLFNSHHKIKDVLKLKYKNPEKIFVHRVDGPITLIRNNDKITDKKIFLINNKIADATIFQSNWSRKESYKLGMKKKKHEIIIINSPDSNIFYPKTSKKIGSKIKLIASSWSSNWRKGFDIYKFLDENLDFEKYEMTFVGNTPIKFKNINYIPPVDSRTLAGILRDNDIFITGSINDPCSNSLLEALHCGLPAVVRNSGGHPELIMNAGLTFNGEEDIISMIEEVSNKLNALRFRIELHDIENIANQYYDFCKMIYEDNRAYNFQPQKFSYFKYLKIMLKLNIWKLQRKIGLKSKK